MGAGIANVSVDKGIRTSLIDMNQDALDRGEKQVKFFEFVYKIRFFMFCIFIFWVQIIFFWSNKDLKIKF